MALEGQAALEALVEPAAQEEMAVLEVMLVLVDQAALAVVEAEEVPVAVEEADLFKDMIQ